MKCSAYLGLMMMVFGGFFVSSAADASALASSGAGLVPLAKSMPDSHVSAPLPVGFTSFCIRFADQCTTEKAEPAVVALTSETWGELKAINDHVNHTLTPEDDMDHYGIAEYWNIPNDGKGDCEDYALMKREELIAAGVSERALRIAVVRTTNGEGHAVLTVVTDHGDYVLDNLVEDIRSWDNTDYHWIERQDPNNAQAWVALSPDQKPNLMTVAASAR